MLCKTDEMSGFGHLQLSSFRHVRCVFVLGIVIRVRHAGVGASMRRRLVGVAVIGGHLFGLGVDEREARRAATGTRDPDFTFNASRFVPDHKICEITIRIDILFFVLCVGCETGGIFQLSVFGILLLRIPDATVIVCTAL